ncbi:MAG: LemA family protein [Candidatus Woesebacteria bacterium]|jgi:LemA protein
MPLLFIILAIVVAIIIYIISIYNSLQRLKTQIKASIQEIGNQLKRQASLIPNLESSVKSYLKHEKGIFNMLTTARKSVAKAQKSGKVKDIDQAINDLQTVVPQINVTVESNPELKADKTITQFMSEITDTADKLTYARRSVIDLSQIYNQKLVTFPSKLVADAFGFKEEKGLETATSGSHLKVSEAEMKDVKVDLK